MQTPWLELAAAWLWRASWQGACLAIVVGAVCLALPRIPARWRSALWLVVLVRLLLPVVPGSPVSLFNLAPAAGAAAPVVARHEVAADRVANIQAEPATGALDARNQINVAAPAATVATAAAPSVSWTVLLAAAWLVGFVAMLAHRLVMAVRLRRLLRSCRRVESGPPLDVLKVARADVGIRRKIELLTTGRATAPAVTGMLRPRIVLPAATLATLDAHELVWLFRHELAHVRRSDVAIQNLWWLACAVHWFNPLVWWAAARARRDTELACDEAVLREAGEPACQQYGHTLLKVAETMVESMPVPAAVPFLTRKGALNMRIGAIVRYRGASRAGTMAAVVIVFALAATGLTDASRAAQEPGRNDLDALAVDEPTQNQEAAKAPPPRAEDKTDDAKPERTMKIKVVDTAGRPLAGAKVHVSLWTNEPFKANRDFICGTDGTTTVSLPQSIDILRLWATYPNKVGMFAQWWPEHQPQDPKIPAEYSFELEPATTISGTLENENGEPIAGAKVEASLVSQPAGLATRLVPNSWLAEDETARVTDADGRWSLDNVPAGDDVEVKLMLSHPDYVSEHKWGSLQDAQGVTMQSLRDGTAKIVMPRGISVSGRVTDPAGNPVSEAVVVWGDDPYLEWGSQELRTDRHGVYLLPPRPAGPLTVTVIADGWAPALKKVDVTHDSPPVDFQLEQGRTIRFVFVDEDGKPVPHTGVNIGGWRGIKSLYNYRHPNVIDTRIPDQANAEGVYEWTWAPPDTVTYYFGKEGYQMLDNQDFFADDREHVIVLKK